MDVFAVILAVYAAIWLTNGRDFGEAAITFFTNPFYNAFPLFGWAKWAVAALLNGRYITGFVPAILLLAISSVVLARVYYSQDVDFFEKAQLDSIRLQKMVDNVKGQRVRCRRFDSKRSARPKAVSGKVRRP